MIESDWLRRHQLLQFKPETQKHGYVETPTCLQKMAHRKGKTNQGHTTGDQKEDWEIFDILCSQNMDVNENSHDTMTALRSELAALHYKRDRLLVELNEMKAQVRCREERALALESETEALKEQAARQNAIVISLKKRIQELEEKERALTAAHNRSEVALQTMQRENRYQEEKAKELAKRVRTLEIDCHAEEQSKLAARTAMGDFVRRLSTALGVVEPTESHPSQECLVHRAADLVQEASRLRSRSCTMSENLNSLEIELNGCREALERAVTERDNFQRQAATHLIELDKLRQEKEEFEIQQRRAERELSDLREKLAMVNKSLECANVHNIAQESTITQLRDESKAREEKCHRLQNEMRHLLETLAITSSTPVRFVESNEDAVKSRVRELVQESKDKHMQIESLKDKVNILSSQLERQSELGDQVNSRVRVLDEEKSILEGRLAQLEDDLRNCEITKETLRRDKSTFMNFLEKLGRALNSDEITKDVGMDLLTESLLIRAEQLARLETDKIVDKLLCHHPHCCVRCTTTSKVKRERSVPDLCSRETSAVYQLQRKVKTLKDQLQRKDLHLELLRRKLALLEENCRERTAVVAERDEVTLKCKKLMKQIERLQSQLTDARTLSQDLKNQLADAADFKIAALERGRKVEELQKRLVDSETLKSRYNRKIALLKEQIRTTSQTADQERTISEHSLQLLRDDLANLKLNLAEITRRESQLIAFKASIFKILGAPNTTADYDVVSKLEKLMAAHREFTLFSTRYDDHVTAAIPTPIRTPRYEDSGFLDQQELSAVEDNDELFNKRSIGH